MQHCSSGYEIPREWQDKTARRYGRVNASAYILRTEAGRPSASRIERPDFIESDVVLFGLRQPILLCQRTDQAAIPWHIAWHPTLKTLPFAGGSSLVFFPVVGGRPLWCFAPSLPMLFSSFTLGPVFRFLRDTRLHSWLIFVLDLEIPFVKYLYSIESTKLTNTKIIFNLPSRSS